MATTNVYEIISDRIIDELEKGIIPWHRPWVCVGKGYGKAVSHTNGRPYSLLNQLLLGRPGEYITWNQCKKEGGSVKKGAKARMVCFWKMLPVDKTDANGAPIIDEKTGKTAQKVIPYLKYYNVFHIEDCDGITAKYANVTAPQVPATVADIDAKAEQVLRDYIAREGITLKEEESDEAYYSPAQDLIHLPIRKQFENTAEYYSTAFHESVHSTGHKSRLDRLTTGKAAAFGGQDYSKEELVAELGAASICHALGLETGSSFKNSVAYIQSWLKALRNDKRMIVTAASKAEKAVALIFGDAETAEAADVAEA